MHWDKKGRRGEHKKHKTFKIIIEPRIKLASNCLAELSLKSPNVIWTAEEREKFFNFCLNYTRLSHHETAGQVLWRVENKKNAPAHKFMCLRLIFEAMQLFFVEKISERWSFRVQAAEWFFLLFDSALGRSFSAWMNERLHTIMYPRATASDETECA